MLTATLDTVAFIFQAASIIGLAYGGLLCLNADSMFQVSRQARKQALTLAERGVSAYPVAAHS